MWQMTIRDILINALNRKSPKANDADNAFAPEEQAETVFHQKDKVIAAANKIFDLDIPLDEIMPCALIDNGIWYRDFVHAFLEQKSQRYNALSPEEIAHIADAQKRLGHLLWQLPVFPNFRDSSFDDTNVCSVFNDIMIYEHQTRAGPTVLPVEIIRFENHAALEKVAIFFRMDPLEFRAKLIGKLPSEDLAKISQPAP